MKELAFKRDIGYFIAAVLFPIAIMFMANFSDGWEHAFGIVALAVGWAAFVAGCAYQAAAKGLNPAVGILASLFSLLGLAFLTLLKGNRPSVLNGPYRGEKFSWVDVGYIAVSVSVGWELATYDGLTGFIGFLMSLYGLVYLAWLIFMRLDNQNKRAWFLLVLLVVSYFQAAAIAAFLKS